MGWGGTRLNIDMLAYGPPAPHLQALTFRDTLTCATVRNGVSF
jgi:hypothetical protein